MGISAYFHDSAASLICDGKIVCAVQEERFTRVKHDSKFPSESIKFCLEKFNLQLNQIDHIVFYDKPFLKFERLLETYLTYVPRGIKSFLKSMPIWIGEKLFLKKLLTNELKRFDKSFNPKKLMFSEHHISHAASAFYPSPFEEAIILTLDGVGEWVTSSVCIGDKSHIKILKEILFPHSLGLLYSAFTQYLGFKVNSGEYKLMGLAPYGKPIYKELILREIVDVKDDGSFFLNLKYFNYMTGLTMINNKFCDLFEKPIRKSEEDEINLFHMNVASSIQSVLEDIVIKITKNLYNEHKVSNLVLSGGVALNCVANGKIIKNTGFKNIWIQPASGDAGGSVGCALAAWHQEFKNERQITYPDGMSGSYLGPSYGNEEIESKLKNLNALYKKFEYDDLLNITAKAIFDNKAVGWFQGNMEFGPRALGNRSILGNPISEKTQKNLNLKVKFRESFRPFAASILKEEVGNYFELENDSPYMLLVEKIQQKLKINFDNSRNLFGIDLLNYKRSEIPAVTHIDYSTRIQTVDRQINPIYYDLIKKFFELSGFPLIVNTSFNVRGEPIVCSIEDAFNCFMGTDIELLVIGNFILKKNEQDKNLITNYKDKFLLD